MYHVMSAAISATTFPGRRGPARLHQDHGRGVPGVWEAKRFARSSWSEWKASRRAPRGELRRQTAEAKAQRLIGEELHVLNWTAEDLVRRRKSDPGKLAIGVRLRRRPPCLSRP